MTTPAPAKDNANSRLIAALAYLGGAISGVVVLAIEKQDPFVRFHAMQSTVAFLGVLVVNLVVIGLPVVGLLLAVPFVVGVVVMWVFLMVKAFQGERYKLPYVGDFAEHLLR